MKYWCIAYPDETRGDVVETLSEDEILKQYYAYWSSKMVEKFGQEELIGTGANGIVLMIGS